MNKRHPQIIAVATICGTHTCMRMISDDGQWASARAAHVSMADSRTERLRLLLKGCNSRHCIARTYLIQQLLMSAGFPME